MGYRPENTRVSFDYAVDQGADWIELDVHLTRDGALAVMHDELVDRTTDGHGLLRSLSVAELRRLDAGSWFGAEYAGERVPLLDEVLEWAGTRGVVVDIEIKNAPLYYDGIEAAVVAAIQGADMTSEVIVISFDHRCVSRVRELDSSIATGVLYAARPADGGVSMARLVGADAVLPQWAYVTREDVSLAHAADLAVLPWATSDADVLRRLVEAGADGIATNHPDVLAELLGRSTHNVRNEFDERNMSADIAGEREIRA